MRIFLPVAKTLLGLECFCGIIVIKEGAVKTRALIAAEA